MLIRSQIFKRLDELVELAYLGFMFDIVGDEFFTDEQKRQIESLGLLIGRKPLIELLYILIRNRPTEGYAKDQTLSKLLDEIAMSGVLPILPDAQQYTVDHAKLTISDAIEDAKKELKKRVRQQILKANADYKRDVEVNRYQSIPIEHEKKRNYKHLLGLAILALGPIIADSFDRAFTSEMTNLVNDAAVDQAATNAMIEQLHPKDAIAYKEVFDDNSLCKWCRKFYRHEDGSPIEYRLSELQANGSNDGKPKSEWKPVVGRTHVRCRCQLFVKSAKT